MRMSYKGHSTLVEECLCMKLDEIVISSCDRLTNIL